MASIQDASSQTAEPSPNPAVSGVASPLRQKTLSDTATVSGVGLHLGKEVRVEIRPAEADRGIEFVRGDIPGEPRVRACLEHLVDRPRRTAIADGDAEVHTIEHLLAALWALGIDNCEIWLDAIELPGLDGSALPYYEAIRAAGVRELGELKRCVRAAAPAEVATADAHITAVPTDGGLRVSYTLAYDRPAVDGQKDTLTQYFSAEIDEESFVREIAPARTFCLEDEVEILRSAGLGLGASTDNTLVLGRDGRIIDNQLRYPDEFVRHKVLDLLGDLYLSGPLTGVHVQAARSGHSLNVELARRLTESARAASRDSTETLAESNAPDAPERASSRPAAKADPYSIDHCPTVRRGSVDVPYGYTGPLDVRAMERLLPHRFPFVMVDRILEVSPDGRTARGLKNVSMNEEVFQGHFPGHPVFPGVLQVEGMAQVAGIMLLSHAQNAGKLAFLLSLDRVKFRRQIVPGDQLIFEVCMKSMRERTAWVETRSLVDGQLAAEAQIRFMLVDD